VEFAALSTDGKMLLVATTYVWDVLALTDAGHEDLLITGTNVVSIKLSPSLTLTIFAVQTEGIQGDSGMERTPRQRNVCMFIFSNTEVSSLSRCQLKLYKAKAKGVNLDKL
jgi:hypothetical protein